jgi:hypothetical protein
VPVHPRFPQEQGPNQMQATLSPYPNARGIPLAHKGPTCFKRCKLAIVTHSHADLHSSMSHFRGTEHDVKLAVLLRALPCLLHRTAVEHQERTQFSPSAVHMYDLDMAMKPYRH